MARRVRRGEIWLYHFRAPDKIRPVLVLTRNAVIEHLHTVIVAPITSTARDIPTEVAVGVQQGLKRESRIVLDHVFSVEQARLRQFVGSVDEQKMAAVCRALAIATGCA